MIGTTLGICVRNLPYIIPTKLYFIWPCSFSGEIFLISTNQKQVLPMSAMFEVWSAKKTGNFVEDLLYTIATKLQFICLRGWPFDFVGRGRKILKIHILILIFRKINNLINVFLKFNQIYTRINPKTEKNNLIRRLVAKLNNLTREFVEINILSPKNLPSPPHEIKWSSP